MIFVDTSVWVAAFRSGEGAEGVRLQVLLDGDVVALAAPVRIEILVGAGNRERPKLRRVLSALPLFYPTDAAWERIDEWTDRAGRAGERFGFADLLIGAIAAENDSPIWSLDLDFVRMAKLGFVTVDRG